MMKQLTIKYLNSLFFVCRLPNTTQGHANVERSTSIEEDSEVDSEEDQIICNQVRLRRNSIKFE